MADNSNTCEAVQLVYDQATASADLPGTGDLIRETMPKVYGLELENGSAGSPEALIKAVQAVDLQDPEMQPSELSSRLGELGDLDADRLAAKIEFHNRAMMEDVMDYFIEIKARMLMTKAAELEADRACSAKRLAAKQEEAQARNLELQLTYERLTKSDLRLRRLATAYADAKEHTRSTRSQVQCWYRWRAYIKAKRRAKQLQRRAEEWDTQVRLKRHVFRAWTKVHRDEHYAGTELRLQQRAAATREEIMAEAEGELRQLRQQLALAQQQTQIEIEARNRLEEDLKRAFMRGVTALNLEAMTVMRRSTGPAACNPIPTHLPPADGAASNYGSPDVQERIDQQRDNSSFAQRAGATATASPARPGAHSTSPLHDMVTGGAPECAPVATVPAMDVKLAIAAVTQHAQHAMEVGAAHQVGASVDHIQFSAHPIMGLRQPQPMQQQQPRGMPGVHVTREGGSPAGPASRYTGSPKVVVTRGPAAEVPKPRIAAPVPSTRFGSHLGR